MRLVSFVPESDGLAAGSGRAAGGPADGGAAAPDVRTGVVEAEEVVDLTDPAVGLPADAGQLLAAGHGALERARDAARTRARRFDLGAVRLLAPVPRPAKVLGIGLNYRAHVAEMGRELPTEQVWFNKQRTCVIGPGEGIEVPRASSLVDYEGELAFVVGRRCRHVDAKRAPEVVAGFTIMNDVSVRDWQWRTPTWTMGKSFDTHGPLGPWLVTGDEVGDPHGLRLRTWVNGELRQDGSTDDMVFSCWEMVEHLSTVFTLEPGDVVTTGTPSGVGAGFDPPRWLRVGDLVRIEVEHIGALENPVISEGGATTNESGPLRRGGAP